MQWLYTAPVYPDGLHWSEDGRLVASAGTVAATLDPYALEERCTFTELRGFERGSVARTGGTPQEVSSSLRFAFETLREFAMRDATWRATVRSVAWSPKAAHPRDCGCLLAVIHSDRKIGVYTLPKNTARDQIDCRADLTESLLMHFRIECGWESEEEDEVVMDGRCVLRLRGGGREKSRSQGRGKGRRRLSARTEAEEVSNESQAIVQNFQFSRELDPVVTASVEAHDGRQFRLDLTKVILALWLEVRSKIPENELPTYKKGEFLFGVDYQIFARVMEYIMQMYGPHMETFGISQKVIETRARSLIRKKAIVSYDPVWKGSRFHQPESVLALIGQGGKEEELEAGAEVPPLFQSTKIVTDERSALCVAATNQTVRQVKPQSGRKRKSMGQNKAQLLSHFPKKISNENYDQRLTVLSAACVTWLHDPHVGRAVLAVGTQSGHVVLWSYESDKTDDDAFHVMGSCSISSSEISVMKSVAVQTAGGDGSSHERLLLAVGDTSGCVKLWQLSSDMVDPTEECHELLRHGMTVFTSDLRPISSLHVDCFAVNGEQQLRICVGKYGGIVSLWQSRNLSVLSNSDVPLHRMKGNMFLREDCHSNKAVTGIVSVPFRDLVATVGLDSQLCLWKVENGSLVSADSENGGVGFSSAEFQPLYGIAASPSGLMLALLRDSGEEFHDAQLQRMVWKRAAHGFVELHSLVQFGTSDSWRGALEYVQKRIADDPSSAFIVDVGQMVKLALTEDKRNAIHAQLHNHQQQSLGGNIDGEEAPGGSINDETTDTTSWATRQTQAIDFIQAVLKAMMQYRMTWDADMSEKDIQRLRAFVSLCHTIKDLEAIQIDTTWIDAAEKCLLVDHAMKVFSLEEGPLSDMTQEHLSFSFKCEADDALFLVRDIMARWVVHFEQKLPVPAVKEAWKWLDMSMCHDQEQPTQSSFDFDHADPVMAATKCCLKIDDCRLECSRCPASFACMSELQEMPWICRVCQRRYLVPPQALFSNEMESVPVCLFCGMFLEH